MSEGHFGRACKTCRRRGRGCDRRLPTCSTCESNGLVCEGYLLQWPGLASRGKFVGKSIPVSTSKGPEERGERGKRGGKGTTGAKGEKGAKATKARRSRRTQPTEVSTPTPALALALAVQPPPDEAQDNQGLLAQPGMLNALEFPTKEVSIDPQLVVNDTSFLFETLMDFQSSVEVETLKMPTSETGTYMEMNNQLYPSIDVLNIPNELKFIMEYHLCEVVPKLCVDNECPQNPYRDYIFPLAIEIPSLMYACAALAACHYNVRLATNQYQWEFYKFKGKAMKRLQEDLYSQARAIHPGTLATILMLCLCDLCQGGASDFESHFQGAKKLMELRQERTLGCFVEQYLIWLDVMAAASHSRSTVFAAQDIQELLYESGDFWGFDAIPCPLDQFKVIHEIGTLHKESASPETTSMKRMDQVQELKHRLLQGPIHSQRGQNWFHLTEAYRYAIILYLLRLFSCDVDEFELNWLVSSVLYHVQSTPPASGWSDQLLWPLFHAAVEIRDTKQQEWIRERAQCMQFSGGFGNVQSALKILEGVWMGSRPPEYLDMMLAWGDGTILLI